MRKEEEKLKSTWESKERAEEILKRTRKRVTLHRKGRGTKDVRREKDRGCLNESLSIALSQACWQATSLSVVSKTADHMTC